jgi:alkanesulfonate monooxygenase SsuD/methylene tetrahydromethanopterin reductase-like flavin-dependent oxidoreductase (luciferase family)
MERLVEGIRLIRQMWEAKQPFKFEGKYFASDFYYLYTKPRGKIPIYCSAIGRRAAYGAGLNTDGLITITPRNDPEKLRAIILPEYKRGRSEAKKAGLGKIAIELIFSFERPEHLLRSAWRTLGIFRKDSWSIPNPVVVEEEGRKVTPSDLRRNMYFFKNWKEIVRTIESYRSIGVNEVSVYTGCDRKQIRTLADNLLSVF